MRKLALLIILFALIIFTFSIPFTGIPQYDSDVSIQHFFYEFFKLYNIQQSESLLLRKVGHVLFFGLLAFVIYLNLPHVELTKRGLLAWGVATILGFCDEVHQFFIVDRSGRFLDVMLDSFGAVLMLYVVLLVESMKALAGWVKGKVTSAR